MLSRIPLPAISPVPTCQVLDATGSHGSKLTAEQAPIVRSSRLPAAAGPAPEVVIWSAHTYRVGTHTLLQSDIYSSPQKLCNGTLLVQHHIWLPEINHCRRVQYGCTGSHILHTMSASSFIEMYWRLLIALLCKRYTNITHILIGVYLKINPLFEIKPLRRSTTATTAQYRHVHTYTGAMKSVQV